ncbi:biotin--[acetyl-CoA-carboxylase] ligase [Arthrobacter glacialis]|nr:biotin--[acetyl-CoA-carboxylase] ligase [Arthrobacter glacialis]
MSVVPDKIEAMTGAPQALNQPALKAALLRPQGSFGRVEIVGTTGSTNTDLAGSAGDPHQLWPDLSVLIADAQEAGKGRLGRTWVVPAGAAMISSVFLRPGDRAPSAAGRPGSGAGSAPTSDAPTFGAPAAGQPAGGALPFDAHTSGASAFALTGYAWLSILAGVALCEALRVHTSVPAALKWPNDVVVNGRKLAGILAQLVPFTTGGPGVVVGAGVNVSADAHQLPTDRATSLLLEGAIPEALDRNVLLPAYLNTFAALYNEFVAAAGDAAAPLIGGVGGGRSLLELAAQHMSTLGQEVRAELPGGAMLHGTATGLGNDGSLLIRDAAGTFHTVSAGDVIHLRRTETDGTLNYA